MERNAMGPLEHLFDNHKYCHLSWCAKKRAEEKSEEKSEDTSKKESVKFKKGYYLDKEGKRDLYLTLKKKYETYITRE